MKGYDTFQLYGCIETTDTNNKTTVIRAYPGQEKATEFYTLYGVEIDGRAMAIIDLPTKKDAEALRACLLAANLTVHSYI